LGLPLWAKIKADNAQYITKGYSELSQHILDDPSNMQSKAINHFLDIWMKRQKAGCNRPLSFVKKEVDTAIVHPKKGKKAVKSGKKKGWKGKEIVSFSDAAEIGKKRKRKGRKVKDTRLDDKDVEDAEDQEDTEDAGDTEDVEDAGRSGKGRKKTKARATHPKPTPKHQPGPIQQSDDELELHDAYDHCPFSVGLGEESQIAFLKSLNDDPCYMAIVQALTMAEVCYHGWSN
jgi:hypothetical protein